MTGKMSRRLVIDASVARAAGGRDDPVSKDCSDFLLEAKRVCHRVVVSNAIKKEWQREGSHFFIGWLAAMAAADKVMDQGRVINQALRTELKKLDLPHSVETKVLKDIHLLESALAADRIVVSLDDKARKALTQIAPDIDKIRSVCWVNPARGEEHSLKWLKAGARNETSKRLGNRRDI